MEKVKNFLFKNSGVKQTVAKNTFWVAVGTTLTKIIRVVVIIYVARILGTEGYGIFTYAMSLVAIFTIFSDIGLTNILTRELTKKKEEKLEYLSTSLVIKLGLLVCTILLVSIFAPLISRFEEAKPLLIIIAVTIVFESLRNFFYAITRSENKMEVEAGLNITAEILITGIVLIIFFKYPSVKSLVWSYMIGNGIGLLTTLFFLRKNITGIFKNYKKELVKPIIKSAWPFVAMGVFAIFMTNIDSVIIGIFTNPHMLGLYAAAQKPVSFLYILPGFLSTSLFPIINKFSRDRENKKLSVIVEKSTIFSLIIALPIVVGGIIIAQPLVNVIFGQEFIGAVATFQILLLSLLFVFPGAMLIDLLIAEDKRKALISSGFWAAVTNVVLDLILIPVFGIIGSAFATVAAQMAANGIFFIEAKKNIDFKILRGSGKMILSTIVMALVTYFMKTLSVPLLVIIPTSALIYFGLLILMKDQTIEYIKQSFHAKNENEIIS